jgi:hypothetical protein
MSTDEALENLLGAYLNEDFHCDYPTAWRAVEDFARREPSYAVALRAQIDAVLRENTSETSLERRLIELGLGYLPSADGWTTHRRWLVAVADRVEEVLRKSPAA